MTEYCHINTGKDVTVWVVQGSKGEARDQSVFKHSNIQKPEGVCCFKTSKDLPRCHCMSDKGGHYCIICGWMLDRNNQIDDQSI